MDKTKQSARIQIVEDEFIIAGEIRRILENFGYTVTAVVNSGEAAIEKAKADLPDIILMDINLQGRMDGIEAAHIIRNQNNIPIIFVTAYANDEKLERAKKSMPFGYILKPFRDQDIKVAIEMALYVSQVNRERDQALQENLLNTLRLEIIHEIATMKDADEKKICDLVLERMLNLSDSSIGFLGFLTADEQTMIIHSWSRAALDQCRMIEKPIEYSIAEAGLWGEPVRKRQPLIVNDYFAPHEAKKGYPEGHVEITRFMSIPVFDDGRVVAVAAVGNKKKKYTPNDISQLNLLMQGAWEQIRRKRMEKEMRMSRDSLERERNLLQTVMDSTPNNHLVYLDRNFNFVRVNEAYARISPRK